jgi:hypothetical protein
MLGTKRDGNIAFKRLKSIMDANDEMNFKQSVTICT